MTELFEAPLAAASEFRATGAAVRDFVDRVLLACGSAPDQAASVADALSEASLRGVDSHGVRLLPHYAKVVRTGRINPRPRLSVERTAAGTLIVNGDNGFGHHVSYHAIDAGVPVARETGVAAIAVINSSHFGAAGCYARRATESGMVAFAFSNSDSAVLPHDGTVRFHGTNPLAFAAPVAGERPYLFDMATSMVPWNKVHDRHAKGLPMQPDTGVDADGVMTTDPTRLAALLPLGGLAFGHKGAGLASIMEIVSAVMTGMPNCAELLGMGGPDFATPRRLGHFFIVVDPERFVPRAVYDAGMARYLASLRGAPAKAGARVMAPGDREWDFEAERVRDGIPVAPAHRVEFERLAEEVGVAPLEPVKGS